MDSRVRGSEFSGRRSYSLPRVLDRSRVSGFPFNQFVDPEEDRRPFFGGAGKGGEGWRAAKRSLGAEDRCEIRCREAQLSSKGTGSQKENQCREWATNVAAACHTIAPTLFYTFSSYISTMIHMYSILHREGFELVRVTRSSLGLVVNSYSRFCLPACIMPRKLPRVVLPKNVIHLRATFTPPPSFPTSISRYVICSRVRHFCSSKPHNRTTRLSFFCYSYCSNEQFEAG